MSTTTEIKPFLWRNQQQATGPDNKIFKSNAAPALLTLGSDIFMAWNDGGIFYSTLDRTHNKWSAAKQGIGEDNKFFGIQGSPALILYKEKIFMAWNGSGNDGIWYSTFDLKTQKWASQKNIVGTDGQRYTVTDSPALTLINRELFMVWHGKENRCQYAAYDSQNDTWTAANTAIDTAGDQSDFFIIKSPSIATLGSEAMMVWHAHEQIYYTAYNSYQLMDIWNCPRLASGTNKQLFNAASTPSILSYFINNQMIMTWKDRHSESILNSVYSSHLPVSTWTNAIVAKSEDGKTLATPTNPATVIVDMSMFMVWIGSNGTGLFYSECKLS